MPASPPDSTGSPTPSGASSGELPGVAPRAPAAPLAWRTNAWLFAATVASVFVTGLSIGWSAQETTRAVALTHAAEFTVALLSILLAHEFGHFIAARVHKVDATLPYFLPLPLVSPFGTMGAVIRMRSVIPTRRALLDIGAAGPLAGLVLAIPIYAIGVGRCEVVGLDTLGALGGDSMQFGDSLLMRLLDHWFAAPVPEGMDRLVSPLEHAGWAGMFVTMINLIPVGQLDGGHVAFALLGPRQNRVAQWVHRSMLVFFCVSVASFVARDASAGFGLWHLGRHVNNSMFWLLWFEVLAVIGSFSSRPGPGADRLGTRTRIFATASLALMAGLFRENSSRLAWGAWFVGLAVLVTMELRWGSLRPESTVLDHPATTGAQPLGWARAAIAVVTLAFFALLFMPTPIAL
jgi:membrane-associated protease RseP (regulator of RpoE activity)